MDIKITTIIFDCFGVVCSSVLTKWYKENMLKRGLVDENFQDILRKFDTGILSENEIADYFSKYKGINSTKEKIQEEIDNYLKLDDNLVVIIKELKQRGLKIALLSNGNASFFERKIYTTYPKFKDLFDEIIISSQIGMLKPNEDIYLYTLKKINSKPEESLFVDDRELNVEAAIKLGMHGLVYKENTTFINYLKDLSI